MADNIPSGSSYDIVSLHNVDDEDFTFEYDRSAGNPPYTIKSGEIRRFPRFLAQHALKHLIDKILTKQDISIAHEDKRNELAEKIVVGEEKYQREEMKTESERLREEVEKMNIPSELDVILAKRKVEEPEAPKREEKFEEIEEEKTEEPKKEVKSIPTRKEIYEYAGKTLNMVLDEKTLKKLDKMRIPQLLAELGDPREVVK